MQFTGLERALASAAHDLKNLLLIIEMALQTIHDLAKRNPELVVKWSERALKTVARARAIAENHKEPLEVIDLVPFLNEVIEEQQSKSLVLGFDFQQGSRKVQMRPTELYRSVMNLIHNAKEAAEESFEKNVTVAVRGTEGRAKVSVFNSGKHIPKRESALSYIFEPGYSTHGRAGLGLSIVKSIVEEAGGHIVVANVNKPVAGVEFILDFPEHADAPRRTVKAGK